MTFVLNSAGLSVPEFIGQDGVERPIRHANEYWDSYGIAIHDGMQHGGDLVFFSRKGWFPSHIGIMVDSETYVHAPGRDGTAVEKEALEFVQIPIEDETRTIYTRSPIGFKSPSIPIERPSYRYHQERV